jgi:bisphosphoglycerate-dependent phosphoglycerate mutase
MKVFIIRHGESEANKKGLAVAASQLDEFELII